MAAERTTERSVCGASQARRCEGDDVTSSPAAARRCSSLGASMMVTIMPGSKMEVSKAHAWSQGRATGANRCAYANLYGLRMDGWRTDIVRMSACAAGQRHTSRGHAQWCTQMPGLSATKRMRAQPPALTDTTSRRTKLGPYSASPSGSPLLSTIHRSWPCRWKGCSPRCVLFTCSSVWIRHASARKQAGCEIHNAGTHENVNDGHIGRDERNRGGAVERAGCRQAHVGVLAAFG